MLLLPDHWTWDFWIARDGADYHLFFLKAPRTLGDPELRHHNARIGHAVGQDLRTWRVLPDALGPGDSGSWDDLATWTGSTLWAEGQWHLFYTGVSRAEAGSVQRIGHAASADLLTWAKDPEPVLQLDERLYQGKVPGWDEVSWRDPWVYFSERHGEYRMLFTARSGDGPVDTRGVIGQARSADLVDWQAMEPLVAPGEFAHLEVPQLVAVGDNSYVVFSVYEFAHSQQRRGHTPAQTGTHFFVADTEDGPFRGTRPDFLCGDDQGGALYAGRLERDPEGRLVFLGFRQAVDGLSFAGGLSDPIPVHVDPAGDLHLDSRIRGAQRV